MKPVYLKMPISFEEKRIWNAKGFKVADIAFMPEDYDNPVEAKEPEPEKPTRGRRS